VQGKFGEQNGRLYKDRHEGSSRRSAMRITNELADRLDVNSDIVER
jgi:hypothetical protein